MLNKQIYRDVVEKLSEIKPNRPLQISPEDCRHVITGYCFQIIKHKKNGLSNEHQKFRSFSLAHGDEKYSLNKYYIFLNREIS